MINLRNNDGSAFIEVAIPRNEAALIAPALAPGWRFVEEVEIGTSMSLPTVPTEAKPEAPKKAKKPGRRKVLPEVKAKARNTVVEDVVRSRLSVANGAPKSFAELAGPPYPDSLVRAALEAMRAAGEVEVTGQKRGTKYLLVAPTAPAAS